MAGKRKGKGKAQPLSKPGSSLFPSPAFCQALPVRPKLRLGLQSLPASGISLPCKQEKGDEQEGWRTAAGNAFCKAWRTFYKYSRDSRDKCEKLRDPPA